MGLTEACGNIMISFENDSLDELRKLLSRKKHLIF